MFALISILLCDEFKGDGIQTIGEMKGTQKQREITRRCRQRSRELLGTLFIFDRVFVVQPPPPQCCYTRLLNVRTRNNPIG